MSVDELRCEVDRSRGAGQPWTILAAGYTLRWVSIGGITQGIGGTINAKPIRAVHAGCRAPPPFVRATWEQLVNEPSRPSLNGTRCRDPVAFWRDPLDPGPRYRLQPPSLEDSGDGLERAPIDLPDVCLLDIGDKLYSSTSIGFRVLFSERARFSMLGLERGNQAGPFGTNQKAATTSGCFRTRASACTAGSSPRTSRTTMRSRVSPSTATSATSSTLIHSTSSRTARRGRNQAPFGRPGRAGRDVAD